MQPHPQPLLFQRARGSAWLLSVALLLCLQTAVAPPTTVNTCNALATALTVADNNPIIIPSGVTISLATCATLPSIARPLTIQGSGAAVSAINGAGKTIFRFQSPGTDANGNPIAYNFTISGLSLLNGFANPARSETGGCLKMDDGAAGTVIGVAFTNCTGLNGGAIANWGSGGLTVDSCTFTRNRATGGVDHCWGGAIGMSNSNQPLLVVTRSTFIGNSAAPTASNKEGHGGAISTDNNIVVMHSTFSGNFASSGISEATGGAIQNVNGFSVWITNTTFTNNYARSTAERTTGGAIETGYLYVDTSTFSGNYLTSSSTSGNSGGAYGGAVYVSRSFSCRSCIFTNNTARSGTIQEGKGGAVHIDHYEHIISNITQSRFSANGVYGASAYGGAISSTYAVTIIGSDFTANVASGTSEAGLSDMGNGVGGAVFSDDQHGEGQQHTITSCTFTQNSADGTNDVGGGAIGVLNDVIITSSSFTSNSATLKTGSCGTDGTECPTAAYGGAVWMSAGDQFLLASCTLANNTVIGVPFDGAGGAVAVTQGGAYANVTQSTFTNNSAFSNCEQLCSAEKGGGGAIYHNTNMNVTSCTFTGNSHTSTSGGNSFAYGGAILTFYNWQVWLNLNLCTFTGNQVISSGGVAGGGAVYVSTEHSFQNTLITQTTFSRNSARGWTSGGGAIRNAQGYMDVYQSKFEHNSVTADNQATGGAIDGYETPQSYTVFDSTFYNNSANSIGGYAMGGALVHGMATDEAWWGLRLVGSSFLQNTASSPSQTASGGAVYIARGNDAFAAGMARNSFDGCRAIGATAVGGAVAVSPSNQNYAAFCRGNTFGKLSKNVVQTQAGGATVVNDLDASGTAVRFCPSVPVYVDELSAFLPILACDKCPCDSPFNPCDPRATCQTLPSDTDYVFCKCPAGTRGNGFTCGPVLTCIP